MTTNNNLLEGFLTNQEDPKDTYKQQGLANDIASQYKQSQSMDGLLKDLQGVKMMSMREVITDIEKLIETRKQLQAEVFGDVNNILMGMNNFITTQGDKLDAVEQVTLKEKLIDVEEFKMQEKINTFRDIAALKKELRDRVAEFKQQESHNNVLDELLNE